MRILANENVHVGIVQELRKQDHEVLFVPEVGLAGQKDTVILGYSEKHDLVLISGDKDFGGLIEFGKLWGRGKVIILRYRIINIKRIVRDLTEVLNQEVEILRRKDCVVIVLSETGYRIHRP